MSDVEEKQAAFDDEPVTNDFDDTVFHGEPK